ncbi:uncharacterized protein [Palaemon carinicauda]|uniref:uncharacterized protein isoform X2 n=1 Tax=Palaemon carinicauda TaxID=392227 RepID=UPI0035B61308
MSDEITNRENHKKAQRLQNSLGSLLLGIGKGEVSVNTAPVSSTPAASHSKVTNGRDRQNSASTSGSRPSRYDAQNSKEVDWKDMKYQEEELDPMWLEEEHQRLDELYGEGIVTVKYTEQNVLGYYCELCFATMNAIKSLEMHCSGMKHLKKKDIYEKSKASGDVPMLGRKKNTEVPKYPEVRYYNQNHYSRNELGPYRGSEKTPYARSAYPVDDYAPRPKSDLGRTDGYAPAPYTWDPPARDDKDPYAIGARDPHVRDDRDPYAREARDPYAREGSRDPFAREASRDPYVREDSRDPIAREDSRDPFARKNSRDPYAREVTRDPYARESTDPYPRESRDPYPRESRDPFAKESRDPYPRESRDPFAKESRDPYAREDRDPYAKESRDPYAREGKDLYSREDRDRRPKDYLDRREKRGSPSRSSSSADRYRESGRRRSPERLYGTTEKRDSRTRAPPRVPSPPPATLVPPAKKPALEFPTRSIPLDVDVSLAGGPAAALIMKLSQCSIKNENDAELASSVINLLLRSLKGYHHNLGEKNVADLMEQAEIKLGTAKAIRSIKKAAPLPQVDAVTIALETLRRTNSDIPSFASLI